MKLGSKLFFGFLAVILIFSIGLGIMYFQLKGIEKNVAEMDRRSERSLDLTNIRGLHRGKSTQLVDYILQPDPKLIALYQERMVQQSELMNRVEPYMRTEEQRNLFAAMMEATEVLNDTFLNEIVPIVKQGNTEKALQLNQMIIQPQRQVMIEAVERLIETVEVEKESAISEAHGKIGGAILNLTLIQIIALIISLVIAMFIGRKLSLPIKEIQQVSTSIANGDLTVNSLQIRSKDELGELAQATNTMVSNIKALVSEAVGISTQVASSSEELMASSTEMLHGIEQVAATAEELASGTETQANHANDTLEMITMFAQSMEQINQQSADMMAGSEKANQASQQGLQSVTQSLTQMEMIEEKVTHTSSAVQELGEKTQEINMILGAISDISEQTNLLALNAAIEAARAGEEGRGFAVVADEVRKLAEQAASSTNQIAEIIQTVQAEAEQVSQAMSEVVQEVQAGSQVMDQNGQAFQEIAQMIEEMSEKIKHISWTTQQMNQHSGRAVQSVENIAAITEEASAGTEELAASMIEQNASMQEVNSMAQHLAEMAEQLNLTIARFKY